MKSKSPHCVRSTRPHDFDGDESISLLENEFCSSEEKGENNNGTVEVPIERTIPRCHTAGFIQGQVQRLGSTEYRRRYLLSLQVDDKIYPLFVAEKELSSRTVATGSVTRFIIREHDNDSVLGLLTKTSSPRDAAVTYTLTHRRIKSCPVAYIRYEVPSVLQVLTEGPARRAFVEVPGRGTAETKEPCTKDGGRKSLNFRGRGREASRKNMQLQNRNGRVVLQFVKWEQDVFNLDFA